MECLVLSQSFTPVSKVSRERAIALLLQNEVEVVESHNAVVRSVTLELKMPSVVRFVRAIQSRKKGMIKFSRENVYARDNGRCQYCSRPVSTDNMTYDHVIPRSQGGQTNWTNIVISCIPCNQKKGKLTLAQSGMHLRTTPVRPKKLSDSMRFHLTWQKGMPLAWRHWLKIDLPYWHGELDQN